MEASNVVLVLVGLGAVALNGMAGRGAAAIAGFFARHDPHRRARVVDHS